MNHFRVTLETPQGNRWLFVEAGSPEAVRSEIEEVASEHGPITKIESEWQSDFDPALHIDC